MSSTGPGKQSFGSRVGENMRQVTIAGDVHQFIPPISDGFVSDLRF